MSISSDKKVFAEDLKDDAALEALGYQQGASPRRQLSTGSN